MVGLNWLNSLKFACVIGLVALGVASSFAADLSQLYEKVGLSVPHSCVHAQDFQLEDLQGNLVSLSKLQGKIIILNFWSTWCKPCVAEMPALEKLHKQYREGNLAVLMINFGESKEKVKDFIKQNHLSLNVLLDPTKKVSRQYRTFALPTTYFLDRDGNFLAGAIGPLEWNSPHFHTLLEGLLNNNENLLCR